VQLYKGIELKKTTVPEPKWLSKEVKKLFRYEINGFSNGLRLTKLIQKTKNS